MSIRLFIPDANTTLRVRVSTAFPLGDLINASPRTGLTPFGRCVLVFPGEDFSNIIVHNIHRYVEKWNADCLHFAKDRGIEMAVMNDLLMYPQTLTDIVPKVTNTTQRRPSLDFEKSDVLTGFHVFDGQVHIVIVEGLCQPGMEDFEAFLTLQLGNVDLSRCSVLWDSTLRFSARLYSQFGCVLFNLRLCCSLERLVKEPRAKMTIDDRKTIDHTIRQLWEIAYVVKAPRVLHKRGVFPATDQLRLLQFVFGQLIN